MVTKYPIELLAPAKDLECGYAAINSGADAVYIGAARFGAREKAGNTLIDIATLTEYAHTYWAKVYVVLNTILYDYEIDDAIQLTHELYDIGVDALIIQDFALIERSLPPIPLIASTQMHNHTPERVKFLEEVGIQRAILARELSLDEIRAIRAETSMELEVFVHGALCVSYSGQCYMSYAIGGRSGNRGTCAQPCRRIYSLVDADNNILVKDKHLLSLKDLNRLDDLEDLLAVGVTSFKIEGRLKDKAYVTNVVSQYRQRLDALIEKYNLTPSSSGKIHLDFVPDVNKSFNRGFTSYFLRERDIKPGSIHTPKMVGEKLGAVANVRNRTITLNTACEVSPGDGVCWFDTEQVLQGTNINQVNGRAITLNQINDIQPGTILFRNHDHNFITKLNRMQPARLMTIYLTLEENDAGYTLYARDEDNNEGTATIAAEKERAIKTDQAVATIQKQLSKLGGTPYICQSVTIQCQDIPFLPVSTLNDLRRNAIEELTNARLANRPVWEKVPTVKKHITYPETNLDYRHNVLNQDAERFFRRHGVEIIEPAVESGLDMRDRIVMRSRQCIKRQMGWCVDKIHKNNLQEPLFLVDDRGHKYRLAFDCDQCEMDISF